MTFPATSPEVYAQNFIREAVCQVRFPRLLEIDSQLPVQFQKLLRDDFPFLEVRELFGLAVGGGGEGSSGAASPTRTTVYDFKNAKGDTTVALCSDYVSVVTTRYVDWATLRGHLVRALVATSDCYEPGIRVRAGLRYVNVIPSFGVAWESVLQPPLVGPFSTDQRAAVTGWTSQTAFDVGSSRQLNLMSAFGDEDGEKKFLLDLDVFSEGPGPFRADELATEFDEMNRAATDAFNWAKGPALDRALRGGAGVSV